MELKDINDIDEEVKIVDSKFDTNLIHGDDKGSVIPCYKGRHLLPRFKDNSFLYTVPGVLAWIKSQPTTRDKYLISVWNPRRGSTSYLGLDLAMGKVAVVMSCNWRHTFKCLLFFPTVTFELSEHEDIHIPCMPRKQLNTF